MKENITMKIFLIGLVLFLGKATALAQYQDIDIKCELSGLDFNLSGKPGYLIEFGSFSLLADGKEKEGVVYVAKFYKLPRTKLILSVLVGYAPESKLSSVPQLRTMMVLGERKVPFFSNTEFDKFFDGSTKHAVNYVLVGYPLAAFDKGGEGTFYMPFLRKKKPVHIMMKCKKVDS